MDKEAWQATIHGVAKSQMRLSTHTHTHTHTHTKSKSSHTLRCGYFTPTCLSLQIYSHVRETMHVKGHSLQRFCTISGFKTN